MNLYRDLSSKLKTSGPIRIGLIGCGKFATMFLAQARRLPGFKIQAIADLNPASTKANLNKAGWQADEIANVAVVSDSREVFDFDLDVVIEATGDAIAGIKHAKMALKAGCHVVMVNVEADVLAGPALAQLAAAQDRIYSQAYGDQPALIAELIDWARLCGFPIIAAGKGTKHLPHYHFATPADVWERYGISASEAAAAGMNPKMFNSFLDGTKSAIEMAAVANAGGLAVPKDGLLFPPAGTHNLAQILADHPARTDGGFAEVVSCLELDGSPVPNDLRWGVFVVFEGPSDYARHCFKEYGLTTDASGEVTALFRPYHMIGLELGISVARACLRHEPTGVGTEMRGDVVATAKADLAVGTMLDGEGGSCVYGKLQPVASSQTGELLPIGLAHKVRLRRPVERGQMLCFADIEADGLDGEVMAVRHQAMRLTGE